MSKQKYDGGACGRYEYVLPAFCFAPADPAPSADGICAEQRAEASQAAENDGSCVDGEKSVNRGAEGHQGSSDATVQLCLAYTSLGCCPSLRLQR